MARQNHVGGRVALIRGAWVRDDWRDLTFMQKGDSIAEEVALGGAQLLLLLSIEWVRLYGKMPRRRGLQ
jgi:hypothetical protein